MHEDLRQLPLISVWPWPPCGRSPQDWSQGRPPSKVMASELSQHHGCQSVRPPHHLGDANASGSNRWAALPDSYGLWGSACAAMMHSEVLNRRRYHVCSCALLQAMPMALSSCGDSRPRSQVGCPRIEQCTSHHDSPRAASLACGSFQESGALHMEYSGSLTCRRPKWNPSLYGNLNARSATLARG